MKTATLFVLAAIIVFASCQSSEIANSKDVNPNTIYADYYIGYTEGNEVVTCKASFRFGGKNGTTLVLNSPSKLQLDGQTLKVDSSKFSGAYYQVTKSFSSFSGKHQFTFFNATLPPANEVFYFKPFSLAKPMATTISKKGFLVFLKGLDNGNKVNISISDTSSSTEDVELELIVEANQVKIPASELSKLKKGPVEITVYTHKTQPLQHGTPEGGELVQHYSLNVRKSLLKN